jgi:RNA polymerase sigma-70 factor (ECF subfamily)
MQNKTLSQGFADKSFVQAEAGIDREADSAATDKEFFIRKVFETDVKKGYDLLFMHYYSSLCSHAVRYVYSREVAEDIVSEVFLAFWKNAVHTHITTSFRSYLFMSVRNKCLTYLKWELKNEMVEELPDATLVSMHLQPDTLIEFDELYLRIVKIVDGLPPQNQKVFLMSRFSGMSYQEIADKLQISRKAVEAHISRALTELRKALDGLH